MKKVINTGFDSRGRRTKDIIIEIDDNECWNCISHCKDQKGYPSIRINKKNVKMSKYIYERYIGYVPKDMIMRHKCDNPNCINPNHLEYGTYKDNSDDKVKRNRQPKGESHGVAFLNESDIIDIFLSKESSTILMNKYGIKSRSTISNIKRGITWSHLTKNKNL